MEAEAVRDRAADVPAAPGCYQFIAGERILYLGKAVNLRSRVASYADPRSERVATMVDRAHDIDFAVTDTETQALLLEANLIKRHQPRYNVRLKDDKSYPLVELTDHEIPRIEVTRDPDAAAQVFGPFTSRARLDEAVKGLREVYGLRGCSDHKFATRDRPCIDFDIGLCAAPCTGEIAAEEYADRVASVVRFFRGETGVLAEPLERDMERAAAQRRFERAANLRDRLQAVQSFHADRADAVAGPDDAREVDVLGADVAGDGAIVARLHSEDGKLVERDRHRLSGPADDTTEIPAVLAAFIQQYYADRPLPDEILVPEDPEDRDVRQWLEREGVRLTVPGAGRRSTLVDLALKNARMRGTPADGVGALANALQIPRPERIEGFDVSHAHGVATVGSNVLFYEGEPASDGYRRKKLDETNDDFANMHALIAWRATRDLSGRDDRPRPDLLVIDGGVGQLEAATSALMAADWEVPAIAIAKGEDRIIGTDGPLHLAKDDPGRQLVRRVRDEAHRFAVQYHQSVRDEVSTALEEIDGVGPARRRRLLRRFGSLEGVRSASRAELEGVEGIGPATADHLAARL